MTTIDPSSRIAIVGAGISALTCGQILRSAGFSPTLFEKSAGYGGRVSTRHLEDGIAFDHGAQYVTAKTCGFKTYLSEAEQRGCAGMWSPRVSKGSREQDWFVGRPAMRDLVNPLISNLDIKYHAYVSRIYRYRRGWCLELEDGGVPLYFDNVVVSAPAPQTLVLIGRDTEISVRISEVEMSPCWALIAAFDRRFKTDLDVITDENSDLTWLVRNNSKLDRSQHIESWVAHVSPQWSLNNIERDRDSVLPELLNMLERKLGRRLPAPTFARAHLWRYALTSIPLGELFLSTSDHTLTAIGDWCLGSRVECAYQSGIAAGKYLVGAFAT